MRLDLFNFNIIYFDLNMSNNFVFEEILKVEYIDKDTKIFEKVQRCEGKTQKTNYDIVLDVNSDIYPMEVGSLYSIVLVKSIEENGKIKKDIFDYELTTNKKNTLMDKYDYVMRGRVFNFSSDKKRNGDSSKEDSLCISISFGGLLLDISNLKRDNSSAKPKAFEDIELDEELFLLMKKIK